MAKNYAAVGECPVCHQGRTLIGREDVTGTLFVICEECESEWASPDDAKMPERSSLGRFSKYTVLERDEVAGHPWSAALVR